MTSTVEQAMDEAVEWINSAPEVDALQNVATLCLLRNRDAINEDSALPDCDLELLGRFIGEALQSVEFIRELIRGNLACAEKDGELGWWLTEKGIATAEAE